MRPASAKNCLTVGATGNGTLQNQLAPFSSRGPTRDGRRKPTVMAPGDAGHVVDRLHPVHVRRATRGTSMATPAVAGAMALVRQYLTEGWYPTGAPVAANAFDPSAALLRAMAVNAGRNDVTGFRVPDNTHRLRPAHHRRRALLPGRLEPHAAGGHARRPVGPAVRRVPGAGHGSHAGRSRSRCAGRTLPATRHRRCRS